MKAKTLAAVLFAFTLGVAPFVARADEPFPEPATFTTLSITTLAIEGLNGDDAGFLYTTGRETPTTPCPVWKIDSNATPPVIPVQIGSIPNSSGACNPSGITFDRHGNLYIADANLGGVIWKLTSANMNPTAPFATGVPGTNGIAFDRDGNLWTGDGTTGQGRVWKITSAGVVTEEFRVQPMASTNLEIGFSFGAGQILGSGVTAVGRDARTLPPGTINAARAVTNTAGSQPLVANGLAFNLEGDLYIADTARGAIWKAEFDRHGNLKSKTGCDTTFTPNTLCLDNIFVAHPFLEGSDGIALDRAGNIWNSANERNAIVVVTNDKKVVEVFRNDPDGTTHLRNTGPLEFPASPFLLGKKFCTSNSDGDRRDNSPRSAGEINAGGAVGARGKISCMDQDLTIRGLPLPVGSD